MNVRTVMMAGMAWVVMASVALAHPVEGGVASGVPEKLRQVILQKWPELRIRQITATEIPEWYLVETDTDAPDGIMYMHRDGRYVLAGNVFDIEIGRNLTKEMADARQLRVLGGWDLGKTVQLAVPSETVTAPMIVFDDLDCPVCRKMHDEVKKVAAAGVNVSVVLFPLMSIHPDAYRKSVSVWCAADRQGALDKALSGQAVETPAAPCAHPIDENLRLAKRLGVNKTPTVFLPNGQRIEGFHSAAELLGMLHVDGPVAALAPAASK